MTKITCLRFGIAESYRNERYSDDDIAAWNLGTLPAGQSRTIAVPFSLSSSLADGAVRQFRARVDTSAGARANASQVIVIDSIPALVLAIEEDRDPVASGESLSYKVVIGNATSIAAPNVTMKASLPMGTVFLSANGGGTHSAGVVTWNLGTAGASKSGEIERQLGRHDGTDQRFHAGGRIHVVRNLERCRIARHATAWILYRANQRRG